MTWYECSWVNCQQTAEWGVGTSGSERLNENWCSCTLHLPKILLWLSDRDAGWGLRERRVVAVPLYPGGDTVDSRA